MLQRPSPRGNTVIAGLMLTALLVVSHSVHGADWPQFRGLERNGLSLETGLLSSWPEGGPTRLWRCDGIGKGYSSAVVAAGVVYVTGDVGDALVITALNRENGSVMWQERNGDAWTRQFPGSRASCTIVGKRLYHMNAHGRVVCLDASTGKEIWVVDTLARFAGKNIQWGLSECLLVDSGNVIVTAGGDRAFLAALHADTGETVWASEPLRFTRTEAFGGKAVDPPMPDVDRAGYASPILFTVNGRRLLAATGSRHYIIADATDGRLVWTREIPVRYEVIGAIPVWCGDGVVFSAPDVGTSFYRVTVKDDDVLVEEAWHHPSDNCHGAFVYTDGRLYGSGYRQYTPWACIDARTGTVLSELGDLAIGASMSADGRLYALSQKGVLALLEIVDGAWEERGRLQVAEKPGNDVWSHPVLSDGRLFLRWDDVVTCYDIRRSDTATP